jgi:hypothetical protein
MERDLSHLQRGTIYILGGISALSIAFGMVGWWREAVSHVAHHHLTMTDAVFRGLKSFEMPEAYDEIGEKGINNIWLELARFTGVIVKFSALMLFVRVVIGENLLKNDAKSKRGHIVVAGNSAFADSVSGSLEGHVVHLCAPGVAAHRHGRTIRLPYGTWRANSLQNAGIGKANKLVVAPEFDGAAIDLALEARQMYPKLPIYVRLRNYGLTQRIQQLPGADRLRAFSDSGVAARDIALRHPPFLMAADNGHERVHALLIGDTDWLEALMAEILGSACTLTFGRPIFSFVCEAPGAFEEHLGQRYPELREAADVNSYSAGQMADVPLTRGDLGVIAANHPVTCVYMAMDDQTEILSASLTFRELASRDVTFTAPIFVRVRGPNGLTPRQPGSRLEPLSLIPFGSPEDVTQALGLFAARLDSAERTFHEAYLQFAAPGGEANSSWDDLKEEYRISNGRAVAHINAKLFEAGFDLRSWMLRNPDIWSTLPALEPGQRLWRNPEELTRLAELEHERWIVDRRLNGWRYGTKRDDVRKLHPDIIPFLALPEETKLYDYAFVEQLSEILGVKHGGITRS